MSDAACAEVEEGLKRVIARATSALDTIRRVEAGEITVAKGHIENARLEATSALEHLDAADRHLWRNISACKGCPTA